MGIVIGSGARWGCVMRSLALVPDTEGLLGEQIRTFLADYLKVDRGAIDAGSCLTDDFGLDLFDVTELMILLEQQFCANPTEISDEPNQIEVVGDLIRHIEQHHCFGQVDNCADVSSQTTSDLAVI